MVRADDERGTTDLSERGGGGERNLAQQKNRQAGQRKTQCIIRDLRQDSLGMRKNAKKRA